MKTRSNVAAEAEVGILVDSTRDEGRYKVGFRLVFAEYMRERGRERCCALDSCEVKFTNIVTEMVSTVLLQQYMWFTCRRSQRPLLQH